MEDVGTRLEAMVVRTTTPDGRIMGRMCGGETVDIRFRDEEHLSRIAPRQLAAELGELLTRLAAGQLRGQREVLEAADFDIYDEARPHWDKRKREFMAKRAAIKASGQSPGRHIAIATIGLREYRVRLAEGATMRLTTDEFAREFRLAFASMLSGYVRDLGRLKAMLKD